METSFRENLEPSKLSHYIPRTRPHPLLVVHTLEDLQHQEALQEIKAWSFGFKHQEHSQDIVFRLEASVLSLISFSNHCKVD